MKRLLPFAVGTSICALALSTGMGAESLPPGQVDFGKFSPPGQGGEFVEVNLTSSLIGLAAKFLEKDEPEVAKLLKGLQLVHVNVIGVNEENRSELESKAQKLCRHSLEAHSCIHPTGLSIPFLFTSS